MLQPIGFKEKSKPTILVSVQSVRCFSSNQDFGAKNRSSQMQKPKPNRETDISVPDLFATIDAESNF
jgi:hypothetical protein